MTPSYKMKRLDRGYYGFTLTEVLITVVIIGILASVGYTGYRKTLQQSYLAQAQDVLQAIYAGERSYFFRFNRYFGSLTASNSVTDWRVIDIDDPNDADTRIQYNVIVSGTPPLTFVATAYHNCSGGRTATASVTQLHVFTNSWPSDC